MKDTQSRAVSGSTASTVDLTVVLGPLRLRNPILTASGTFGYGEVCAPYMDLKRLGGIVLKTITPEPRVGNPPPRLAEFPGGMLNSIGLQNPGLKGFREKIAPRLSDFGVPVIVSIAGESENEYTRLAEALAVHTGIAALELNISCPNVERGGIEFSSDPASTSRIVASVRRTCPFPVIAKLSPLVTDIGALARAAEDGGAHALCLVNTLPGLLVDWRRRRPVLGANFGGMSGPALKPIALRQVFQARRSATIPIIGVGGVFSGEDALEFLVAGASAIQVGTATYIDPAAPVRILEEVESLLRAESIRSVADIVGSLELRGRGGAGPG